MANLSRLARIAPPVLAGLAFVLCASTAWAHCFLDHSTPSSASVVTSPPSHIVLYFDSPFDPSGTTVRVLNEKGDLVSGDPAPSSDNRALTVPLTATSAGQYFVKWRAFSPDGDHTNGAYSFTVKPAS